MAITVGWLPRGCEDNHIQLRLTDQAARRSARWGRTGDAVDARPPVADSELSDWFVVAARFERTGVPEIQPGGSPEQTEIVVHGRWILNDEGEILRRAGWGPLRAPAIRQESFRFEDGQWHLVPNLGRDLGL